jgi:hypothetical protein
MDWALIAVGALAFLFSFISYYKFSVSGAGSLGDSASYSAWHDIDGGGFVGWFGIIIALVGTVVVGLSLFAPQVTIPVPVPPRLLALYVFVAAAVFEILALVLHPKFGSDNEDGFKASFGHGFGFWLCLLLAIAAAVLSYLRLKATGGKLPWEKSGNATPPPYSGGYPQQ